MHAVARLYAGAVDDVEIPVERLAAASGGVPRRVHRAAGEWARRDAARHLGLAAERAASERTDLRAAEDDVAGDVARLQAVRERAALEDGGREVVACPFKGLASYDVADAELFFGRERLVAEMVARLAGAPLIGIVGSSGSGKSSALRAGLLAALAAGVLPGSEDWQLALLRPGEHPVRALERATAEAAPASRLVVAVDQFEELFTSCRDEAERAAFVDELVAQARDPARRALVLVAVRADFYGRCAAYPGLSRLIGADHVLVGPMRRDELRRAIELARPPRGPDGRRRRGRRADRRRRGRTGRAAAALDRASRALAASRWPSFAHERLRADGRRARRDRAAGRERIRAARAGAARDRTADPAAARGPGRGRIGGTPTRRAGRARHRTRRARRRGARGAG